MNFIKNKKISPIVIIIYFTISFCISLTLGKVVDIFNSYKAMNWYVSNKAVNISLLYTAVDYDELISAFQDKGTVIEKGLMYYFDKDNNTYDGKAIYFDISLNGTPKLLQGRFLNNKDFKKDEAVVVIGKNLLSETTVKNGDRFFEFGQNQYKVIGVCGDNNKSNPDNNRFYINLNYYLKHTSQQIVEQNSGWDFDNINGENNAVDNLESNLHINITEEMQRTLNNKGILNEVIHSEKIDIIETALVFLTLFVTLINTSFFWFGKRRKEIAVRKLCGGTNLLIIKNLLISYGTQAVFAAALAFLAHLLLNISNVTSTILKIESSLSFINGIALIIISLLTGIVTVLFLTMDILKLQCNDLMRRSKR